MDPGARRAIIRTDPKLSLLLAMCGQIRGDDSDEAPLEYGAGVSTEVLKRQDVAMQRASAVSDDEEELEGEKAAVVVEVAIAVEEEEKGKAGGTGADAKDVSTAGEGGDVEGSAADALTEAAVPAAAAAAAGPEEGGEASTDAATGERTDAGDADGGDSTATAAAAAAAAAAGSSPEPEEDLGQPPGGALTGWSVSTRQGAAASLIYSMAGAHWSVARHVISTRLNPCHWSLSSHIIFYET